MRDGYHPIESYGLIGNRVTSALVGPDGSVDWFPLPHVESASAFSAILDADDGGHFRVCPDGQVTGEQAYLPRTNVQRTTFETAGGTVEVTDFVPAVESNGAAPRRTLFRKVECTAGAPTVTVEFSPRFDYARAETRVREENGAVVATGAGEKLVLDAEFDLGVDPESPDAVAGETLGRGETRWLALRTGDAPHGSRGESGVGTDDGESCEDVLDATVDHWENWAHGHAEGTVVDCVFAGYGHDQVLRSGLVLGVLSHAGGGAIAAAPTTSLPEEIDVADKHGVHRGNFPQAFSHVGLVNSALYLGRLSDPETEGPDPVGIWLGEGPAIPD